MATLRIIERGIRESVEGSRRQTNNLQTIENSIHNMRQIAAGDVGNTRVDEPTGDEIVDTGSSYCESGRTVKIRS